MRGFTGIYWLVAPRPVVVTLLAAGLPRHAARSIRRRRCGASEAASEAHDVNLHRWNAYLQHPPAIHDCLRRQFVDVKAEDVERGEQPCCIVEGRTNEVASESRGAVKRQRISPTTTNSTPWTVKEPINSSKSRASSIDLPPQPAGFRSGRGRRNDGTNLGGSAACRHRGT